MRYGMSLRTQSHGVPLDRDTWPIAASLLQFPSVMPDGRTARSHGRAWERTLREVADAGFALCELTDTWLQPGSLTTLELDDLREAAAKADIEIAAIGLIRRSVIDEAAWQSNLEYSHRSIDAAAALGVPVVSIGLHEPLNPAQKRALWFWTEKGATHAPDDRQRWEAAVRRIQELADHAADNDILVSLEMYEGTFLGTGESAVRLVEEVDRLNVGLNPDVGNLIRAHGPIDDWRETLQLVAPYANYWHVKSYSRIEDSRRELFLSVPTSMSLGLIDYRWAVREFIAQGFSGVITCEHYGGDGLSVSAENHRYLRTILPPSVTSEAGHSARVGG